MVPGVCWSFAGSQGHLTIELSHSITISHVTLGHISKMVSPSGKIASAPRMFSVFVSHRFLDFTVHTSHHCTNVELLHLAYMYIENNFICIHFCLFRERER